MTDFAILIREWYQKNARNLPWRAENDPYKIWLSEIILQQTRVSQGMDYYYKFTAHYPTVKDLATASENEVLNDWQGLGYYSRARNLHAAAKYIHEVHAGIFPGSYEEIRQLKGVGDYTASAIASFAYNLPHAVVDGNVYRVISRLLNEATPIDTTKGKKLFKMAAEELLNRKDPATHNQAMMELGALVCAPKNPDCINCPVQNHCLAFAEKTQLSLPVKSKKTKVRDRYFHYLIIRHKGAVMLKKRGSQDVWQGLYDFPLIENTKNQPDKEQLKNWNIQQIEKDTMLKHILTHQRIYAHFWLVEVKQFPDKDRYVWVDMAELDAYPMPQLLIRYLKSAPHFEVE
ncbi:MAG: A/G-specific adenine glycosylase [Crocinitomicaceae bacterium]